MSEASIVGFQDGEVVLPGPVEVRMVEDGSGTDHRLAVAVLTVPPGTDGPPPHWHQQHDETFYVRCRHGSVHGRRHRRWTRLPGTFVVGADRGQSTPSPTPVISR